MIIKASVTTLQRELAEKTLLYSKYLETIVGRQDIQPPYGLSQVIAIRALIEKNTRIKPLYKAISEYCLTSLMPTFGEKWRLFFGTQKNYDLYAHLQVVLGQEKYCPDALTAIEDDYDWRSQEMQNIKATLKQELRQEVLASPEVIVNEEIVRLNELTAQLQAQIDSLQQALRKAEQARDYWHGQYQTMKVQRDGLADEKGKYKEECILKQKRINELEEQIDLNRIHKEHQGDIPAGKTYQRQSTK